MILLSTQLQVFIGGTQNRGYFFKRIYLLFREIVSREQLLDISWIIIDLKFSLGIPKIR